MAVSGEQQWGPATRGEGEISLVGDVPVFPSHASTVGSRAYQNAFEDMLITKKIAQLCTKEGSHDHSVHHCTVVQLAG